MPQIADHINLVLTETILRAYKSGIRSVIDKNKKTILNHGSDPSFSKYDDFNPSDIIDAVTGKTVKLGQESPLFAIDYTTKDLKALSNFKVEAFTVATIGEYDLQEQLKELAIDTIENHQSDNQYFIDRAREISNRYIRGDWLRTNINTAASSSYRAAEWNRLQDPAVKDIYPAYQYKTRQDSHVRDEHKLLEGKVFRNFDPIWKSIYPPNGWNCRCFVIPLDQDEVNSGKYTIENELRNESETKQLLKDAFPDPKDAKNFMRNSGETDSIWEKWISEKLKGMNWEAVAEITKRIKEYEKNNLVSKTIIKKIIPKKITPPKEKAIPIKETIKPETITVSTKKEAEDKILDMFEQNTGARPGYCLFHPSMELNEINERLNQLSGLFKEYKVDTKIVNYSKIEFVSNKRIFGEVRARNQRGGRGEVIANFGHKTEPYRERSINMKKSFNDESLNKFATQTHEFAHFVTMSQAYGSNDEFWAELKKIKSKYSRELRKYNNAGNNEGYASINLGLYASTKIDEFLAEGFKEYKLSKSPSKYALQIGKLFDKFFKKL